MLGRNTWLGATALAAVVAVCGAPAARAGTTFNFDDLTPATSFPDSFNGLPVPAHYGDPALTWTNLRYAAVSAYAGVVSGVAQVDPSSGNVVISDGLTDPTLTISGPNLFTFASADLSAMWNRGMTIDVVGALSGAQQYETSTTIGANGWTSFINPFAGTAVDSLTFKVAGASEPFGSGNGALNFIMDNVTLGFRPASPLDDDPPVGAVPEPSSLISAAAAVAAGLGLGARRRRRAA